MSAVHDAVANWGDDIQAGSGSLATARKRQKEDVPMQHRTESLRSFHQSRPVVPCAQCGEALFAPEWSEYFDDRRIRHVWSCDRCDYQFETMVYYPQPTAAAA